ncbi:retrotransposon protein, putative, ty1-copia subclass [Tanacetum coccineum]
MSILHSEKLTGSNFTNWHRNLRIVLRCEKKMSFMEQPMAPAPNPKTADQEIIDKTLEKFNAYDMLEELKTMFEEQAKPELFETVKAFHACKQEDGQSISSYFLKMKSYLDTLVCLGFPMPNELDTIAELHDMLKLHEKGIPKKVETPAILAIRGGKIQKNNKKKLQRAKGKTKLTYAPKPMISPPPKRDNLTKDSICHNCKQASTSGIFTIELYYVPNKYWVYDTGYGTPNCNTTQGLRRRRKLKYGALKLYVGNGMHAVVEAIGSFDLILLNGLVIVLDCVVFVSCLVDIGYMHTFLNYDIFVMKDGVFYFNAIPHDGIYKIDMQNLYPNVRSIYNVSNKRAKHVLDSTYLWHCHLGHINKKPIEKLLRDEILQPTEDESFDKCKSCISGKMACYPKETIGYYFYNPRENKIFVTRYAELFKNDDTHPSNDTSEQHHEVETHSVEVPICRSGRIPQAPDRYGFYVDVEEQELGDLNKPPNYKATLSDHESNKWLDAMNAEMQSMKDNQKMTDIDGNVHTFNARLVAKGYTQTYGVDYGETFSLVADIRAIRILLAITAFYNYEIWQMHIKTAFLNGHLSEDVYMVKPEGFVDPKHSSKVCKLQRSIYGLKQASRSWNKRFDEEIKKVGFTQNPDEPC